MRRLIPNSKLPERYGKTRETIYRWKRNPRLKFPAPAAHINNQDYFDDDQLIDWEKETLEVA
jgi:hypothetical protein